MLAANKRLNTAYLLKESFGQLWDYPALGALTGVVDADLARLNLIHGFAVAETNDSTINALTISREPGGMAAAPLLCVECGSSAAAPC